MQIDCGWGATLARIKYLYPAAKVYGIEESENVATFGNYLAEIIVGIADKLQLPYPEKYFDYIFLGQEEESIENLREIRRKLKKYLKQTGRFIGGENMDREWEFLTSPEEYKEIVIDHQEEIQQYLKQIDECLKNKTASSITEYLHIMQKKDVLDKFLWCVPEIAYAHIFSIITIKEVQKRADVCYLLNGSSVKELTRVLKRVEFRIWEVEFDRTTEAEQHLYETMQQYYITPEAMSCIIVISAMDKCDVFITLSCIYIDHQDAEGAIALLEYSLEWYPEDERILQVLSKLCRKTGKIELAEKCEGKLKCVQQ